MISLNLFYYFLVRADTLEIYYLFFMGLFDNCVVVIELKQNKNFISKWSNNVNFSCFLFSTSWRHFDDVILNWPSYETVYWISAELYRVTNLRAVFLSQIKSWLRTDWSNHAQWKNITTFFIYIYSTVKNVKMRNNVDIFTLWLVTLHWYLKKFFSEMLSSSIIHFNSTSTVSWGCIAPHC